MTFIVLKQIFYEDGLCGSQWADNHFMFSKEENRLCLEHRCYLSDHKLS